MQEQPPRKKNRGLILIRATIEDLPLLYRITQSGMADVNQSYNPRGFTEEEKIIHYQKYVSEFKDKLNQTSLIYSDGYVIGRLRVEESEECLHIGGIQLLPEYQSKGIGGEIMEKLKQENKKITLMVHKVNDRAINFYKKYDFLTIGETETQIKMEWYIDNNLHC